jgi:hypothetical protein
MKPQLDPIAPGMEKRTVRPSVTEFGNSGSADSRLPWQGSNRAATTNNPMRRTGRISPSLETTVEAGESLMGDPLRNPLTAKLDLSASLSLPSFSWLSPSWALSLGISWLTS